MTIRLLQNTHNYVDSKLFDTVHLIDDEEKRQLDKIRKLFGDENICNGVNMVGIETRQKEYVDNFCQTVFDKLSKYTKIDYSELIKVLTNYETGLNLYATTTITKSIARMISRLVIMFAIESFQCGNQKVDIQIIDPFKDMFQ